MRMDVHLTRYQMPPNPRVLTDEEKAHVEALAAVLTSEQIADYLGISRRTFYDIMERDDDVSARYKKGRAKAIGGVAKGLINKAMEGNIPAQIFFLKTQAGWKEAKAVQEVVSTIISADELSDDELAAMLKGGDK